MEKHKVWPCLTGWTPWPRPDRPLAASGYQQKHLVMVCHGRKQTMFGWTYGYYRKLDIFVVAEEISRPSYGLTKSNTSNWLRPETVHLTILTNRLTTSWASLCIGHFIPQRVLRRFSSGTNKQFYFHLFDLCLWSYSMRIRECKESVRFDTLWMHTEAKKYVALCRET